MPPNDRMFTQEETMHALREKAKESDDFVVKVGRRMHPGAGPTVLANLSGARVDHFISPELWVPGLIGGGKISLQGYHVSDLSKPVGSPVQFDISDPPKDVDISVVTKPDWRGPAVVEFPKKESRRQQEDLPLYMSPPGPGDGVSATSINQPWSRSPGGGLHRQEYAGTNGGEWRVGASALEAERRALEKDKLDAERVRHRDELDAQKKAHEADMRSLRTELLGAIQQQKPTGPDPMITMMLEQAKQAAEDRRAAAAQAAEDRRAEAARQERAETRFQALLEKISDKPKEDPLAMFKVVNELVANNSKKNDGLVEAQTKMMHTMTEMTGQQMGIAMDFISTAADMQLGGQGEKEPGWIKGLEKVVQSVGAMAKGATARRIPQPPGPPAPLTYEEQAKLPPQQAAAPQKAPPVIVQVEMAIRSRHAVAEVAKALVDHFQDPSVQQALAEAGNDFEGYVTRRLGNWVNEDAVNNQAYLKALFAEIEKQFGAAGFLGPEEEAEEEAEVEEQNDE